MKPAAPSSVQPPQAEAAPSKAGAQPFGKGFVTDAWYFVALGRDVAPGQPETATRSWASRC